MRAFLVLGPPSSGTKLFTEILVNAGCGGDSGNEQRWDTRLPIFGEDDPVVWRRSVPHGEQDPDIVGMVNTLRDVGCQVYAYITTRDWTSILNSRVLKAQVVNYEVSSQRLQQAYLHIFSALAETKVPYAMVSYEAVVEYSGKYIKRMLKIFGLDMGELPSIYSGNEKYYQGSYVAEKLVERGVGTPIWLGEL